MEIYSKFQNNGNLLDYLIYYKLNTTNNIEQNTRLIIVNNISKLFLEKVLSFSIVGSTIYGEINKYTYLDSKPNLDSDIDIQIVNNKIFTPKELNFKENIILENLFNKNKIDILSKHTQINGIKVGIHFIKKRVYKKICNLENFSIKLGRDTAANTEHILSSFDEIFISKDTEEILDKNTYIYTYNHNPIEVDKFVPKLYHRMILNSLFLFGNVEIKKQRLKLVKLVNEFAKKENKELNLNIFNPKLMNWSKMYKDFMIDEIYGSEKYAIEKKCYGSYIK